ncbi:MAG: PilZ domain-containing protein, partial [Clostridia bacterium]|nr:PilZ domain-containing protein [Clostridia bacterium]
MYTKRMTRIDFNAGALLKYKGVVYKGTIENMSLNGICIVLEQSNNEIAINEKVEVEITVEEGENRKTIELMCIVIRRDTSRYGLK